VVHHAAVWSRAGPMEFHVATVTGWSSLLENPTFNKARTVTIESMTIDDFVRREHLSSVRILKLDIEGAETNALLGAQESLERGIFEWILLEVEPQRLAAFGRSGHEIATLMERYGFEPVAIVKEDRLQAVSDQERIPGTFSGDYLYCQRSLVKETLKTLFRR